jgi:hypothetical protein
MNKTNSSPNAASSNSVAKAADIRPIKAPVPIPNLGLWIGSTIALLLALLLAWWLWRRHRRQADVPAPIIVVPPHEKARARLLEALALMQQPRPFCILVSDTIRVYLEERFDLRAPERTTEEFLEELQSSPMLSFDQKRALGDFLMRCDLVKFARYEPGEPELRGTYEAAVRLVDETQAPAPGPDSAVAAAPAAGGGAA